jgi:hypothetical protein
LNGKVTVLRLFTVKNDCLWEYFRCSRASKSEAEYNRWGKVSGIRAGSVVTRNECKTIGRNIVDVEPVDADKFSTQRELLLHPRYQLREPPGGGRER